MESVSIAVGLENAFVNVVSQAEVGAVAPISRLPRIQAACKGCFSHRPHIAFNAKIQLLGI